MSLFFPFPLPTTGAVVFSQCLQSIEHRQIILNADEKRARVRDALKRAKRADNPDILAVINAIDEYLPYLFTLIDAVESQELQLLGSLPVFSWRLPMKAVTQTRHLHVVEPPRVDIASLEYEKGMALFTYALAFVAFAETALQQSESPDKWKLITSRLKNAESVFRYLADQNLGLHPSCSAVLDLHPSTISALITMISGSLHMAIIYKSQAQVSQSSSLLVRVSLFAAEKFGTASQLVSGSGGSTGGSTSKRKLLSTFLPNNALSQWLKDARSFSIAYAEKYMADTSQEKGQVGLAVAYLQNAKEVLATVDDSGRNAQTKQLKTVIDESLVLFKAENDRIAFQPVPSSSEVEQNWPSGREVVSAQPAWTPPYNLLHARDSFRSPPPPEQNTENRGYY